MHGYSAGNLIDGKRSELAIQQSHVVTIIDERAPNRQEPQGRQMIIRNAAADCRMRRIDDQDLQAVPPKIPIQISSNNKELTSMLNDGLAGKLDLAQNQ